MQLGAGHHLVLHPRQQNLLGTKVPWCGKFYPMITTLTVSRFLIKWGETSLHTYLFRNPGKLGCGKTALPNWQGIRYCQITVWFCAHHGKLLLRKSLSVSTFASMLLQGGTWDSLHVYRCASNRTPKRRHVPFAPSVNTKWSWTSWAEIVMQSPGWLWMSCQLNHPRYGQRWRQLLRPSYLASFTQQAYHSPSERPHPILATAIYLGMWLHKDGFLK